MEILTRHYGILEKRILANLAASNLRHRTKHSTGLWLGPLVGLSVLITFLKEDNSYSEICLLAGIAGAGLVVCCICLYIRLSMENVSAKDFHAVYFLPAIILSTLFLLVGNKGLLVSVAYGIITGSLSTWGVIQMMSHFPKCFTLGEATAVTHSIVLFLLSTLTNLPLRYHLPPIHDNDIITTILQVMILFVMLICILCAKFLILRELSQFYFLIFGILFMIVIPVLYILLDRNPFFWIILFVFSSFTKILLLIYWALCSFIAFICITYQIYKSTKATTSIRKIFHILSVMVYIPGLIWEPTFLYLASGAVLILFSIIELIRILKLPPWGKFFHDGFSVFADEKDSLISLTPLYLLCGLSSTLWLPTESMGVLSLMSGVLTIGVGDTAASFVGSNWGKHKWAESKKSIEGTLACACSQLILIFLFAVFGYVETTSILVRSICSVILVSLVEARTEQVDNLALPFLMYLCLTI